MPKRYIDADKLIELAMHEGAYGYVDVHDIRDAPAADVVEVKHAQWMHEQMALPLSDGSKKCVRCSSCLTHWDNETNYCPQCGARMKGEKDNG